MPLLNTAASAPGRHARRGETKGDLPEQAQLTLKRPETPAHSILMSALGLTRVAPSSSARGGATVARLSGRPAHAFQPIGDAVEMA